MQVAFRCDASFDIGSGHVMRCLTLAAALREYGHLCRFICRDLPGHMAEIVSKSGFPVTLLTKPPSNFIAIAGSHKHEHWAGVSWETDVFETQKALPDECEWLVLDHYAFDFNWEKAIRTFVKRVFVIDDLADRAHEANLVLDQSIGRSSADYDSLLPSSTIRLIGPQYAILRPEFLKQRSESIFRRQEAGFSLHHLLIFMGGVDLPNITSKMLRSLDRVMVASLDQVTVVMGPLSPALKEVRSLIPNLSIPTRLVVGAEDMATLMYEADLAIGGVGVTALERCCLGLPTLTVVMADNQRFMAKVLQDLGASITLADITTDQDFQIKDFNLPEVLGHVSLGQLKEMTNACINITDGQGTSRVLAAMGVTQDT
jgi:UDP-2,4-diacetamido-2,4,6-trideoxy-beta-L-altropyranose hydrolase